MKKGKFYIVVRDTRLTRRYVEQVDGYFDTIETSDGHSILIGIHSNYGKAAWTSIELSTGLIIGDGTTRKVCLEDAQSKADAVYKLLEEGDELITDCKQLINEANEGDIK